MEFINLNKRSNLEQEKKLKNKYVYFEKLITELEKKEIPSRIVVTVNQNIEEINSFSGSNKDLRKQIRKSLSIILKLIQKELKQVPKNYYLTLGMTLGMSIFGIPLGVVFGATLGNMGLLGIGLPIGMGIGLAIGAGMDKKAFEEGRQLDLEMNF